MQENNLKKLVMTRFPQKVGELTHSVQFLKLFSFLMTALSLVICLTLAFAIGKDLPVVTLDVKGRILQQGELPKPDDEIREAVKYYLGKRFQWTPQNVVTKLKESESLISPLSLKAFQSAVVNVARFSKDKNVSQRVYPDEIKVNLQKSTVFITGDRVTTIQGLKAAGDMKLELSYLPGPRTTSNPWGVYFSLEREE